VVARDEISNGMTDNINLCTAHIDVGRVGCGLHNAAVYLGPRECKAKYEGHAMD
jgi:hypothetical protein